MRTQQLCATYDHRVWFDSSAQFSAYRLELLLSAELAGFVSFRTNWENPSGVQQRLGSRVYRFPRYEYNMSGSGYTPAPSQSMEILR